METRVAVISLIVTDKAVVSELNAILHAYGDYIIGRMGLPYKEKNVNIICVAMDAPQDVISAMSYISFNRENVKPVVILKTAEPETATFLIGRGYHLLESF